MKKISILLLISLAMLSSFCVSCSTDPEEEPVVSTANTHTIYNVISDTGKIGKTTYFRFADSSIVTGADTATAAWDIAFRSTSILINGGSSGIGQGGAQLWTGSFATLTEAPTDGYKVDAAGAPAITGGSGNGWYNYDANTNLITPIPGRVLVIRCGNGKFAKLQITSYYFGAPAAPDATSKSRYYTFSFVYQPNGSNKF